MTPREFVLARLEELRALAEAAPGEWEIVGGTHDCEIIDSHGEHIATTRLPDPDSILAPRRAAHIAAHSPSLMAGVWGCLAAEAELHYDYEGRCARIGCSDPLGMVDGCCYWLRRLAASLGYGTGGGESIVCRDYPDCDREHAGGAGGVPVHPPAGSRVSGDEPLIPDVPAAPAPSGGLPEDVREAAHRLLLRVDGEKVTTETVLTFVYRAGLLTAAASPGEPGGLDPESDTAARVREAASDAINAWAERPENRERAGTLLDWIIDAFAEVGYDAACIAYDAAAPAGPGGGLDRVAIQELLRRALYAAYEAQVRDNLLTYDGPNARAALVDLQVKYVLAALAPLLTGGGARAWLAISDERAIAKPDGSEDVISSFAHREPHPLRPEFQILHTDAALLRSDLRTLLAAVSRERQRTDRALAFAFAEPATFDEASPSQERNAVDDFAGRPTLDELFGGDL